MLATFEGHLGMHEHLRTAEGRGSIPSYAAPEEAIRALAQAAAYAAWRAKPFAPPPELDGIDTAAARALVGAYEEAFESGPVEIDAGELLACYGLDVWPSHVVRDPEEAAKAAAGLGFPVVLKVAGAEAARRAGTVRLGLGGPDSVRHAYAEFTDQFGAEVTLAVQRMAPQPAVPTVVGVTDDPAFGPVVSFGLGEVTARLLQDEGFRLAPLTPEDAAGLVRSVRAAPLLFGEYGYPPVAVDALEELLVRVGRLAGDLPEVARLDLEQVLVGQSEVIVLGARAILRTPQGPRPDGGPRRLV